MVELPDAFLAPEVSLAGLHFASEHEDGRGSLTISTCGIFLHVVRRKEAFWRERRLWRSPADKSRRSRDSALVDKVGQKI
ncbi:hypothetical protein ACVWZ4_001144 [Bradyrhizobium sp. USDA 4472]